MESNTAWTIVDLQQAKKLYALGLSTTEIGVKLNRPRAGVRYALNSAGVQLRCGRPRLRDDDDPWAHQDALVKEDAIIGSMKLLRAIQLAGVRP